MRDLAVVGVTDELLGYVMTYFAAIRLLSESRVRTRGHMLRRGTAVADQYDSERYGPASDLQQGEPSSSTATAATSTRIAPMPRQVGSFPWGCWRGTGGVGLLLCP